MTVLRELEGRCRERGVRLEHRLAIVRELAEPEGEEALRRRIEDLERRIHEAARAVREALS